VNSNIDGEPFGCVTYETLFSGSTTSK
jgi:hypothetical protein